jgi:hypothetical protein
MRQGFLTPVGLSELPTIFGIQKSLLPKIFRIQKSSHSPISPRSELIPRLIAKVG